MNRYHFILFSIALCLLFSGTALPAATGSIEGVVNSSDSGKPLGSVNVAIAETKQETSTDANGHYKLDNISAGKYTLTASAPNFKTATATVEVKENLIARADLSLPLSVMSENVVVSASPYSTEALRTYQPTDSLSGDDLQQHLSGTLGETLKEQPGVNMRDFGPGAARPVIRGFDGDRVLILQDGSRTSDLSSQSGDHAVPIDPASVDKIEVVRGPATLLYGSNAIGGVVNAVSSDIERNAPFQGIDGDVRLEYGSNNQEGAGNGHIDFGTGNWIFHGSGGGRHASNYSSGEGEVLNSETRTGTSRLGLHYVNDRLNFGASYGYDNLRYGIPPEPGGDETIDLALRRNNVTFDGMIRDIGFFSRLRLNGSYVNYAHDEIANGEVDTTFKNEAIEARALFDQQHAGNLGGTLGFWALHRTSSALGEEILSPNTTQNTAALFAYEEYHLGQSSLQFGGRFEHTNYSPDPLPDRGQLPDRTFDGFSGSVGVLHSIGSNTVIAANYALAYRAPAIEELYNNGPHDGTLSFEVGDPNLNRELGNSFDASLRRQSDRFQGEFNVFYAHMQDFVFLAPTGEIDEESGLPIANYSQATSRFVGYEVNLTAGVTKAIWLKYVSDYVNAELTDTSTPIPRIPPFRNRFGAELRIRNFSIQPEFIVVSKQDRVFTNETETNGYDLFNLRASYGWNTGHTRQAITAALTNGTNEFYLNHVSFIKDRAPEPGRSLKIAYSINFF